MATGTGKTITALCAMVKCYEALQTSNKGKAGLAVFIVCPFRHLVEQWAEDVRRFGIKPIVGYGASAQTNWRSRLPSAFNFRLALSATLERYGDADGTQVLKDYFGQKCIEYELEQVMADGILTPYKYHPVIVNLSDKEAEDYERLSREIGRCLIAGSSGKRHLTERGKHLALQRAQISP